MVYDWAFIEGDNREDDTELVDLDSDLHDEQLALKKPEDNNSAVDLNVIEDLYKDIMGAIGTTNDKDTMKVVFNSSKKVIVCDIKTRKIMHAIR